MCLKSQIASWVSEAADLPEGVRVFVFGSAIEENKDSDVDLLIVYETDSIQPETIVRLLQLPIRRLQGCLGRIVHPVILSVDEESEVGFIENEHCVEVPG